MGQLSVIKEFNELKWRKSLTNVTLIFCKSFIEVFLPEMKIE